MVMITFFFFFKAGTSRVLKRKITFILQRREKVGHGETITKRSVIRRETCLQPHICLVLSHLLLLPVLSCVHPWPNDPSRTIWVQECESSSSWGDPLGASYSHLDPINNAWLWLWSNKLQVKMHPSLSYSQFIGCSLTLHRSCLLVVSIHIQRKHQIRSKDFRLANLLLRCKTLSNGP